MGAHVLAEEKLTQEVDTDGWDDLGDVYAFRYLPEGGAPEDGLQVHATSCSSFPPLLHTAQLCCIRYGIVSR